MVSDPEFPGSQAPSIGLYLSLHRSVKISRVPRTHIFVIFSFANKSLDTTQNQRSETSLPITKSYYRSSHSKNGQRKRTQTRDHRRKRHQKTREKTCQTRILTTIICLIFSSFLATQTPRFHILRPRTQTPTIQYLETRRRCRTPRSHWRCIGWKVEWNCE